MKKSYSLYRIDWVDAASNSSWTPLENYAKPNDFNVHTVGWLIYEDKNYYVLAQNMSSAGNCADRMQIPKKWVKRVRKLTNNIVEYRN